VDDTPSPPHALCQASGAESAALSLGGAAYADVVLSAAFEVQPGRGAQAAGLIFRVQDRDNYYVLEADAARARLTLSRNVAGRLGEIAHGSRTVAIGRWQTLQVEAVGDRLRGLMDGEVVVEATDDTYPTGGAGLWARSASTACTDDVQVNTPPRT
jgi:hypothetical protein